MDCHSCSVAFCPRKPRPSVRRDRELIKGWEGLLTDLDELGQRPRAPRATFQQGRLTQRSSLSGPVGGAAAAAEGPEGGLAATAASSVRPRRRGRRSRSRSRRRRGRGRGPRGRGPRTGTRAGLVLLARPGAGPPATPSLRPLIGPFETGGGDPRQQRQRLVRGVRVRHRLSGDVAPQSEVTHLREGW